MATFFKQPVDEACCEDPCADRDNPCDPCIECNCPPASSACTACPQHGIFGYMDTLSATFYDNFDGNVWTFTSLPWIISSPPVCHFRGQSDEILPCSVAFLFQFSAIYGWWATTSGTCITSSFFWGSPQFGCNDDLENGILYKDGDLLADLHLTINGE